MNNKKEIEIERFIEERQMPDKQDYLQALLIAIMMISYIFIPVIGAFLLFVISLLNLKKRIDMARMSCPRCNEKFGKIGLFSNISTLNKCQNCNLEIKEKNKAFSKPLLMTLATVICFMGGTLLYLSIFIKTNYYGFFLGGLFVVGAIILFFQSQKNKKT